MTWLLAEAYPYLILDAHYERVREAGVMVSQAVLFAVAVDLEGRRQVLAVSWPIGRANAGFSARPEGRRPLRRRIRGLRRPGMICGCTEHHCVRLLAAPVFDSPL